MYKDNNLVPKPIIGGQPHRTKYKLEDIRSPEEEQRGVF